MNCSKVIFIQVPCTLCVRVYACVCLGLCVHRGLGSLGYICFRMLGLSVDPKPDPYDHAVSTDPSLQSESDFGGREIEKNLEIKKKVEKDRVEQYFVYSVQLELSFQTPKQIFLYRLEE